MTTALSVHSFGGGFVFGVREAGWQVPVSLESSSFGAQTSRLNNPGTIVVESQDDWAGHLHSMDPPDLVFGNPACSCWSPMGRSSTRGKEQWRTDPALQYTIDLVAAGWKAQPQVWVTESVPAFWRYGAAADIAAFWMQRGYDAHLVKLDAKFFGVSQQRRRVFLFATKREWHPMFPVFEGMVPVGMALEGVEYRVEESEITHPEFLPLLENTPPKHALVDVLPADWPHRRPRFMDHRLPWELPSGTIAGHDVYYHPHENRKISWREAAAVCGYPSDWQMVSSRPWEAVAQLARAVMPPLGTWVGNEAWPACDPTALSATGRAAYWTHWATSQKIDDFRINSDAGPWDISTADPYWVERGVEETWTRLGL